LLPAWLPAWCMLLHFPCHCLHLFSLSHITKFLSWLLRLLVREFANLVNITSQLSTLPFDAFLVACSLVIFCDFCSQLARAPSTNSQSGYFLCLFSYEKIYFWIQRLSLTVLGDESCCKPYLAKIDNFRMNTRSGRYGATYNMVGLRCF
jgi:hypothetical protein